MSDTLGDALRAAKSRRNVQSKLIIFESGVSKSQFYRIIRGTESPSAETKARMAEALEVSEDEFDRLFAQTAALQRGGTDVDTSDSALQQGSSAAFKIGVTAVAAFLIGGVLLGGAVIILQPSVSTTEVEASVSNAVEGDKTLFIDDVTIPDGTIMLTNQTFVKTWRVKNIGSVVWKDRYLKRITPQSELLCSSPAMVPIPETAPGETVDISVTFTTPHLPVTCRSDWKTADHNGNLYFPEMHGLYSIVKVVTDYPELPD